MNLELIYYFYFVYENTKYTWHMKNYFLSKGDDIFVLKKFYETKDLHQMILSKTYLQYNSFIDS